MISSRWMRTVLLVTFGVLICVFGSSLKNTYQVFFTDMVTAFSVDRGDFAISGSLFVLVIGVASPLVGYLADRFGARVTLFMGVVLAGVVFLGMAIAGDYVAFAGLYGVGAALAYTALSYVPLGVLSEEVGSPRWRGLIYAVMTNGAAIGFMVLSPLWVYLGTVADWRTVFAAIGVVFLLPLAALSLTALRLGAGVDRVDAAAEAPIPFGWKARWVLASPVFWTLAASFAGCGFTMALIDVHVMPYLEELSVSPAWRALAIASLGATELFFGLLAGYLCDRRDRSLVLAGCYALRALAIPCLVIVPDKVGVLAFSCLFGASYLGTVVATTALVMETFDARVRGLALGGVWLFHQLGALACTQLGAELFDALGSYRLIFLAAAGVSLAAALASGSLRRRRPAARPAPGVPGA
ncbi:MFS transporter [Arhodomonas sp. AD133]|uniref:MFS transporter n=1 Tax=Arhodomonas sp. AD133 TaxID=3415009 RepID=UPI003EB7064F